MIDARAAWLTAVLAVAACASDDKAGSAVESPPTPDAAAPSVVTCSSGVTRSPNESENNDMMPGHGCNDCHNQYNSSIGMSDAPVFAFAGTIYPTLHEPDDCVGSDSFGAQVVVTDSNGVILAARATKTGNFSLTANRFALPYQAKVLFQGRERRMLTPQMNGDCNTCHTASGTTPTPGGLIPPGRIQLP